MKSEVNGSNIQFVLLLKILYCMYTVRKYKLAEGAKQVQNKICVKFNSEERRLVIFEGRG